MLEQPTTAYDQWGQLDQEILAYSWLISMKGWETFDNMTPLKRLNYMLVLQDIASDISEQYPTDDTDHNPMHHILESIDTYIEFAKQFFRPSLIEPEIVLNEDQVIELCTMVQMQRTLLENFLKQSSIPEHAPVLLDFLKCCSEGETTVVVTAYQNLKPEQQKCLRILTKEMFMNAAADVQENIFQPYMVNKISQKSSSAKTTSEQSIESLYKKRNELISQQAEIQKSIYEKSHRAWLAEKIRQTLGTTATSGTMAFQDFPQQQQDVQGLIADKVDSRFFRARTVLAAFIEDPSEENLHELDVVIRNITMSTSIKNNLALQASPSHQAENAHAHILMNFLDTLHDVRALIETAPSEESVMFLQGSRQEALEQELLKPKPVVPGTAPLSAAQLIIGRRTSKTQDAEFHNPILSAETLVQPKSSEKSYILQISKAKENQEKPSIYQKLREYKEEIRILKLMIEDIKATDASDERLTLLHNRVKELDGLILSCSQLQTASRPVIASITLQTGEFEVCREAIEALKIAFARYGLPPETQSIEPSLTLYAVPTLPEDLLLLQTKLEALEASFQALKEAPCANPALISDFKKAMRELRVAFLDVKFDDTTIKQAINKQTRDPDNLQQSGFYATLIPAQYTEPNLSITRIVDATQELMMTEGQCIKTALNTSLRFLFASAEETAADVHRIALDLDHPDVHPEAGGLTPF